MSSFDVTLYNINYCLRQIRKRFNFITKIKTHLYNVPLKTKVNSSKDFYFHSISSKPCGEFSVDLPVFIISIFRKIILAKISTEMLINVENKFII